MSEDSSPRNRRMNTNTDPSLQEQKERTEPTMRASTISGSANAYISTMDPKWKNWWIRGVFAGIMIGLFIVFIYMGPLALTLLSAGVFTKCFQEIIKIGHSKYQEYNLPLYRVLNWLFYFIFLYYIIGYNLIQYYPEFFSTGFAEVLATYHKLTCFFLYVFGFVMFVLTLQKDFYGVQFTMFGWTHITLFFMGSDMFMVMQNIYEGLFWFLIPVTLVICNDIMAYVFGFFFGRTKLINLSPKKTWEGFLGALFSTILFGLLFAFILAKYDLACYASQTACENSPLFKYKEYNFLGMQIQLYPVMIHTLMLAIFASLIAPFGGFFASGFKRAFKIKDFSDAIPGHGGLMDRMDCQILMVAFANVYYFTFCSTPNIERVLGLIGSLSIEQQHQVFETLQERLGTAKT
ncbi:PREDICTED: phosphatidate cytidylyltransferase, photoreceptor-specific-like [Amphimedon queenslandica]|uniref:Phosphatidate cytidylyltransferase n=1 Tax=Amphimedon queenslandica TaxID=400682 RepID=A0A1X7VMG9_AMPQE|nr:PREDICTED: phosphatidate cytidylyltransferase, photoreceptor-specific-like [Amphimedon queenslandica]|eukprot:XP_003383661.1 PREDICTED: phosphatidate cytidylyltransferase, photoreceptor-specific-like [Amphimedon queenslandica]